VHDAFKDALARSLERDELLRALKVAIAGLLREAGQVEDVREMAARLEPQLRKLTAM
jgi:hypothetical protein